MTTILEQLAANDALCVAYIERHKSDPCERCGSTTDVEIIPTGSIGKLTPRCASCIERGRCETAFYWNGFEAGQKHERSKSWWRRLLLK